MKNALQLFKRLINAVCYPLLKWVVNRLDSSLKRIRIERFFSQLQYHGKNCSVQWPIHVTGHKHIILGDNVSIAAYVHIWGEGGINIGDRVIIASHTAITSLTHDYNQYYMYNTLINKRVTIEDDVWIGSHSVILPGIKIGRGAVIGAGSVVTKNVEPFTVVAGVPAHKYKLREVHLNEEIE